MIALKRKKSETVLVYIENNPEYLDSFEVALVHEEQKPVEFEVPEVRRSTYVRRSPVWHSKYIIEDNIAYCILTEDEEPPTFHETLLCE